MGEVREVTAAHLLRLMFSTLAHKLASDCRTWVSAPKYPLVLIYRYLNTLESEAGCGVEQMYIYSIPLLQ